mgnify:CR=1 FL=1
MSGYQPELFMFFFMLYSSWNEGFTVFEKKLELFGGTNQKAVKHFLQHHIRMEKSYLSFYNSYYK